MQREAEFKQLGIELATASDYLTNEARRYVQFGDKAPYDNYWKEVNETKTRDHVVARLTELKAPQKELDLIEKAKRQFVQGRLGQAVLDSEPVIAQTR